MSLPRRDLLLPHAFFNVLPAVRSAKGRAQHGATRGGNVGKGPWDSKDASKDASKDTSKDTGKDSKGQGAGAASGVVSSGPTKAKDQDKDTVKVSCSVFTWSRSRSTVWMRCTCVLSCSIMVA